MLHHVLTEDRLRATLMKVAGAESVVIGRDEGKFVAVVVSPVFAGRDEHERQAEVWRLILAELDDSEQAQVAFVFTNTADEKAQAEREAAAGG